MHALVLWLLDQGHAVRLVVGDAVDEPIADQIRQGVLAIRPGSATIVRSRPPARTFEDLLEQLADCELVVASRYHNLVGAALTATPLISLGYGPKNAALMAQLGLPASFCHDLGNLDPEALRASIATAIASSTEITATLATRVERLQRRLEEQFALLSDLITLDPVIEPASAAAPHEPPTPLARRRCPP